MSLRLDRVVDLPVRQVPKGWLRQMSNLPKLFEQLEFSHHLISLDILARYAYTCSKFVGIKEHAMKACPAINSFSSHFNICHHNVMLCV